MPTLKKLKDRIKLAWWALTRDPMWVTCLTYDIKAGLAYSDIYVVREDREEAMAVFDDACDGRYPDKDPQDLTCACIAPIFYATEPHWEQRL